MNIRLLWSRSRLVRVGLEIVAAAFALSAPALATAATLVDIPTDVSDPPNLSYPDTEPSIAVNPLDPMKIAVVAFSGAWGPDDMAPVWKSDDGGATWRRVPQIPEPAPGLMGPGDQKVAFDADGKLYVTVAASNGQDFVYRQASSDPDAPLIHGAAYGDDQPHLEIDKGRLCLNHLYSPWRSFLTHESMDSDSGDSGATMRDATVSDDADEFRTRTTRIALAPDGKAYVAYKVEEGRLPISMPGSTESDFERAHFMVARSDDCGATWSALGDHGVSVSGAVTTLFTNQFGNKVKGKVASARSSDAWIAVDPRSGDIYVAYINRDASGFSQIYVGRSTDRGVSWARHRVTDGTHHAGFPNIAVNEDGTVGVLYVDFDDSAATTIFRHRFARSVDHGVNWTPETLQSMDPGPLNNAADGFLWGDFEGLTAVGKDFLGVFTGQSKDRSPPQLDVIFFKVAGGQ